MALPGLTLVSSFISLSLPSLSFTRGMTVSTLLAPLGFLWKENVIMLPDGLVERGGMGGGLCREVTNTVDVAPAADPRPQDIHPLTPRGHDTGAKPSETRGEACDELGIVGPPWMGPTLTVCSLSPTLGHQPQVSVLELSVRAWGEGSVIPKPG